VGRISASHTAGLDLIDKLFFNQILVGCLFTEELFWLKDLDADLERELTHKGVTGVQRQITRHGVLCLMETELSESLLRLREVFPDTFPALPENINMHEYEQVQRYNLNYFQGTVLAMLDKTHQCDKLVTIEIAKSLLGKYKDAPATFRYQLVERMFSYEFINAPIDCFTWLAKMGVLDSSKYPGYRLKVRYSPEFLERLALLCELDIQRDHNRRVTSPNSDISWKITSGIKNISKKSRRLLFSQVLKAIEVNELPNIKNSFPIVSLNELDKPDRVQHFFNGMNTYATRVRVFQGSLGGWVGMLCGGYVQVLNQPKDQNKPIYSASESKKEPTENSLTGFIANNMNKRGFTINARTIYERHRDFKETFLKMVTTYYRFTLATNVAIPPYMIDFAYDNLILQVGQLKPKPRRNPRPKE
jgi:hypothetical protein